MTRKEIIALLEPKIRQLRPRYPNGLIGCIVRHYLEGSSELCNLLNAYPELVEALPANLIPKDYEVKDVSSKN